MFAMVEAKQESIIIEELVKSIQTNEGMLLKFAKSC
jgi:hypothetical protein